MKKLKIAVVTGSRAEYGLLYWLMREIKDDPQLELKVIATAMHLSTEFGLTFKEIENDGFFIDSKVESQLSSDTSTAVSKSIGLGIIGFADALTYLNPDWVILLGDRFEILAAAQAAFFAKIPIAHLHGGEVTEGAFDESIRHAITKFSSLHFVAAEPYRKRVIQLGESPDTVFNVGASCLDHITRTTLLSRSQLEEQLDFKLGQMNFLVTYHPETLATISVEQCMEELFAALDHFSSARIIFTKSNADPGGRLIGQLIDEYVGNHSHKAKAFISLGSLRYLSLLKECNIVIGNSSSGIIEAPYFKKITVNIGRRQEGRIKTRTILDCDMNRESIYNAIQKGLALHSDIEDGTLDFPYGVGNTAEKIKKILKGIEPSQLHKKSFYDLQY